MTKKPTQKPKSKPKKSQKPKSKPAVDLDIGRYTAINEVERRVRRHLPDKTLKTISKQDELLYIRQWCAQMGKALENLGFRVTRVWCAGNLPLILISEFRLIDPSTKAIEPGKARQVVDEYAELRFRAIKQHTFTWQGLNRGKGSWGVFQEIGRLKWMVRKYEILQRFNIDIQEFKFAPILFVSASDGQIARLRMEGGEKRKIRSFPNKYDKFLIAGAHDLTMTEKTLTQLELAVKEGLRKDDKIKRIEEGDRDRQILYVAQAIHDAYMAGKLKQNPPNRIVSFFNQYAAMMVKYALMAVVVWVIGSIIIAVVTNQPLFSYMPDLSGGADPGIIPEDPGVITDPGGIP